MNVNVEGVEVHPVGRPFVGGGFRRMLLAAHPELPCRNPRHLTAWGVESRPGTSSTYQEDWAP